MADIHGDPRDADMFIPAAPGPGPAPVPYGGTDLKPEPPQYEAAPFGDAGGVTAHVLAGVTGLGTAESPAAHDIAAGPPDAPYYPGPLVPVDAMGDPDAGGRDDVAGTVAGAVGNAEARWHEFAGDTYAQGSTIGDLMTFGPSPLDPGTVGGLKGGTDPSGQFYDPPRGGAPETFTGANTGNEPPA